MVEFARWHRMNRLPRPRPPPQRQRPPAFRLPCPGMDLSPAAE